MDSVYICARFGRQEEARELAERLVPLGLSITSSWLWQHADEMYNHSPKESAEAAIKDVREVRAADGIIYLSEKEDNPWGRGGRHVEFGVAVAEDLQLHVIGPLENLFHYLPDVLQYDSIDDFIAYAAEQAGD